jgi:putative endonuclease
VTNRRQAAGRAGEDAAVRFLRAGGWRIRTRNWRGTVGEIDVVAEDGPCLVLVEVRARRGKSFGTAEESIGPTKQRRMASLAEEYAVGVGWTGPWRVDVVAVDLGPGDRPVDLRHYRDALLW